MEIMFLLLAVVFFFLWYSKKKSSRSETEQDMPELHEDKSRSVQNIKAIGPTFVCDFVTGYDGQTPVTVKFRIPDHPGHFMIGNMLYSAMIASGFKNIGVCSQNIYDRIACGDLLFYVQKGNGKRLLDELKLARSFYRKKFQTLESKSFFNDYMGENMKYFQLPYITNVEGVSYSYDSDTPKIISRLSIGEKLYLRRWKEAPDNQLRALVFTEKFEQIGYISLPDTVSPLDTEFRKQIEFGIPFIATVLEKGIVQGKDIWWCRIQTEFNVPYPADSEMTYITGFGRPYHSCKGCCGADWEVPLCWVQKFNVKPCKKCQTLNGINFSAVQENSGYPKVSDDALNKGYPCWQQGEEARKSGDFETAFRLYNEAVAVGYKLPFVYESYAQIYRKLKDYEKEISVLDEAIEYFAPDITAGLQSRKERAKELLAAQKRKEQEALEKARRAEERKRKQELKKSEPKRSNARPVIQCNDDGSVIKVYPSIAAAAQETGVNSKSIREVANGRQKHAGGFCWKYVDSGSPDNT